MRKSLSEVFVGMVDVGRSTLTVMRKINGIPVEPCQFKDEKEYKKYWGQFTNLCQEILLSLVNNGIIYQDLRLGQDCTYDILIEDEKNKMRLIDFESLCTIHDCNTWYTYGRHPEIQEEWGRHSPHYILFQQCLGVAYAWKEKIGSSDFKFPDALNWFQDVKQLNIQWERDVKRCVREGVRNVFDDLLDELSDW